MLMEIDFKGDLSPSASNATVRRRKIDSKGGPNQPSSAHPQRSETLRLSVLASSPSTTVPARSNSLAKFVGVIWTRCSISKSVSARAASTLLRSAYFAENDILSPGQTRRRGTRSLAIMLTAAPPWITRTCSVPHHVKFSVASTTSRPAKLSGVCSITGPAPRRLLQRLLHQTLITRIHDMPRLPQDYLSQVQRRSDVRRAPCLGRSCSALQHRREISPRRAAPGR
jgi:hypothetical protein